MPREAGGARQGTEVRVKEASRLVEFVRVEVADLDVGFDLPRDVVGLGLRKGDAALLRARDESHLRHDVERLAHVVARDFEAVGETRFRVGFCARPRLLEQMGVYGAEQALFIHDGCWLKRRADFRSSSSAAVLKIVDNYTVVRPERKSGRAGKQTPRTGKSAGALCEPVFAGINGRLR